MIVSRAGIRRPSAREFPTVPRNADIIFPNSVAHQFFSRSLGRVGLIDARVFFSGITEFGQDPDRPSAQRYDPVAVRGRRSRAPIGLALGGRQMSLSSRHRGGLGFGPRGSWRRVPAQFSAAVLSPFGTRGQADPE